MLEKELGGIFEVLAFQWLAALSCRLLFLRFKLLPEDFELPLGVKGELSVLNPGEIRRLSAVNLACGLSLVLSETYDGLAVLSEKKPSGIVHGLGAACEIGKEIHIVLQLVRISVKLAFEHLVGGDSVSLGRVRILEILTSAVEPVCGPEISRLHCVVYGLDVHHLLFVEVQVNVPVHEKTDPLDFLGQHRKIELG